MGESRVCIVVCTCPTDMARDIASQLLEARLVACVNVVPTVQSFYRWEGELQEEQESMLVIKTTAERYGELESRLAEIHSYDVPEIIRISIEDGLESYLSWVEASVKA
jgi:periplasmic divalent cation tolerance protein